MSKIAPKRPRKTLRKITHRMRTEYKKENQEMLSLQATKAEFEFIEYCLETTQKNMVNRKIAADILITEVSDILDDWVGLVKFKNENRR